MRIRPRSSAPLNPCATTATRSFSFMCSTRKRYGRISRGPALLVDLETQQQLLGDSGVCAHRLQPKNRRPSRTTEHTRARCGHGLPLAAHRSAARYHVARIPRAAPERAVMGLLQPMVSAWRGGDWFARLHSFAAPPRRAPAALQFVDVLRARHAKLHPPPAAALPAAVCPAHRAVVAAGACVCQSISSG